MAHPKENTIVVNATEHNVTTDVVTFEQIVQLAFPNQQPNPDVIFKITYTRAESKPHQGTLGPGGSVTVKHKGTTFDATFTNRS